MGSLFPIQDLNLNPGIATSLTPTLFTTTTEASSSMVLPKIEPKLEPLDEFSRADLLTPPIFSNPSRNFSFNSQQHNTVSSQIPISADSENENAGVPDGANVYSEFSRISDLFRDAFAERLENSGEREVPEQPDDSRAIVPVSNVETQVTDVVVPRKKYPPRSAEMVRVTDLLPGDQRYYRDEVRKTRMLFDTLRVRALMEDEKNQQLGPHRRTRGDLKAAHILKEHGLWMNRDKRIVGALPGVIIGDLFFYRMELCVVGLHGQCQAGIDYVPASQSSNREPIATSVIVSGGYEDDEDAGDVIIYTGHGGQDKASRQHVHQKLEGGNLAMERTRHYGIELRVIRGFKYEGSASGKVYVYDGLYKIVDYWFDVGKSGFGVYKYKLLRIKNQPAMGSVILRFAQTLRIKPLDARPIGYVSLDISRKKENVPVYLFNDLDGDHDPVYFEYLLKTVFPPYIYQHAVNGAGCECTGGCMDNCFCAMKNGGQFAYDINGILVRGKPLVFECGPHCQCPPTCRNRVSQKGVRNRFEVFRSTETGWGVRSLDLIQAGSFICEYAGVVLTREQAQIFSMNGDSLIYPGRFAKRWKEWGDLSKIYSDDVPPAYPSVPPLDFAMDVSRMRNVACYMSHSAIPNVLVQPVLYDHNNVSFPHLMLFAMENIPPLRELSIDYGVPDDYTGKLAICG